MQTCVSAPRRQKKGTRFCSETTRVYPILSISLFEKFETFFSKICAHSEWYRYLLAGIFEILTFYGSIAFPLSPVLTTQTEISLTTVVRSNESNYSSFERPVGCSSPLRFACIYFAFQVSTSSKTLSKTSSFRLTICDYDSVWTYQYYDKEISSSVIPERDLRRYFLTCARMMPPCHIQSGHSPMDEPLSNSYPLRVKSDESCIRTGCRGIPQEQTKKQRKKKRFFFKFPSRPRPEKAFTCLITPYPHQPNFPPEVGLRIRTGILR